MKLLLSQPAIENILDKAIIVISFHVGVRPGISKYYLPVTNTVKRDNFTPTYPYMVSYFEKNMKNEKINERYSVSHRSPTFI